MRRVLRSSWVVCGLVACRPSPTVDPGDTPPITTPEISVPADAAPVPPADVIAGLESRLLQAQRVHLVFEVESRGLVESDLRGILVVAPDGRVLLEAQGKFDGKAGVARIECDGTRLVGSSGTAKLDQLCPAGLGPALVLGLVRMGVLHNVARAWAAKPPDRAELGPDAEPSAAMDAWVTTQDHRRPTPTAGEPERTASFDAVAFDVVVDGNAVGDATLHLDADGNPSVREQTVRFPGADGSTVEMSVIERYESVEITPRP